MSLEITVKLPGSTTNRTLTFLESPIRIGRNQLNDIPIDDPFVSEWHGTIRFDDEGISYADLGSTNGSVIDGIRLAKNAPTRLTAESRILLGRIELAISGRSRDTGSRKTMAWGHPPADDRGARRSLDKGRSSGFSATPPPLAADAAEKGKSGDDGTLVRQRQILEAFSEAFIGLRKGYEQFGAEVGVRAINGRTPLHRAHTSQAVLEHLLQPTIDVATVKHDLIAIFADFGIHHIAMMAAVTEGVRALLQSFDPRANDLDVGARLFSASKSKQQWRAYLERFDQVLTEDQDLHAVVFGPEFARAYARVTLGDRPKRNGSDTE
ncbi:MAG TPA: type VI secretion system-associated FHA domain protein [Polyangia bacterium]|nr:type VI secretion system-associated FHA domain protein [Polyangia bacterium]